MLAEAANACFYAGNPAEMLVVAERARAVLPANASVRARFMAAMAAGMARILGGDAAAGAEALHQATELAESSAGLREDLRVIPWLAVGPLFLREAGTERSLLEHGAAHRPARTAVGALPFMLNLIARDQATTDRWAIAEASYQEAIEPGPRERAADRADVRPGWPGLAARPPRTRARVPRSARPKRWSCPPNSGWGCTRSGRRPPWESSNSAWVTRRRRPATSSGSSSC